MTKPDLNTETTNLPTILFADVVLPVPIPKLYTYRVPTEFSGIIGKGSRVIVQFGKTKILTAIVHTLHEQPPDNYEAKYLLEVLDDDPLINRFQFQFFQWIADYYLCTAGDVFNAAIPAGLKLSSNSRVQLNPDFNDSEEIPFTEKEKTLIHQLNDRDSLDFGEAARLLQVKSIHPILKSLLRKGKILLFEEIKERYSPKTIQKVRLHQDHVSTEAKLKSLFSLLDKKPAQLEVLLTYLRHIPMNQLSAGNEAGIEKKTLATLAGAASSLQTLIKKNIFEEFLVVVPRYPDITPLTQDVHLSPTQLEAKKNISLIFEKKDIVLLHGITGSGKTEVYIELIKEALAGGSQVLYLLPEIALTTQIVSRLRKVFGRRMGVYHSRFSDNERVDVWKGMAAGTLSFVVGVRSSIFLPFDNLGLVIVDEEHESSYKQYDPSPRYHARDCAIMLAKLHHAKALLGSATPSIESFYHAREGKWGFVSLTDRYGDSQLPEIELVDMKIERRNKTLRNDFSSVLMERLTNAKENQQQVILFQNRRGYAPFVTCMDCAYIPKCGNCSVSLTYHLHKNEINCHYCGYKEKVPRECPNCGSTKIKSQGLGTEKIEEDLKLFFPESHVERMDLDTTRKKHSYQNIIENFESGKTDILVGTQMVSKGFDFKNVGLVGIFDADRLIHFPDFRSYERAFQMLIQVSGRAGRRTTRGKVVIQSGDPSHIVLQRISSNDYEGLYLSEIEERRKFHYPPFSRIIKVTCKDMVEAKASALANDIAARLVAQLGKTRVLGPEASLVFKIRNYYLFDIFIKIEKEKINLPKVKQIILREVHDVMAFREYTNSRTAIDVDPV